MKDKKSRLDLFQERVEQLKTEFKTDKAAFLLKIKETRQSLPPLSNIQPRTSSESSPKNSIFNQERLDAVINKFKELKK